MMYYEVQSKKKKKLFVTYKTNKQNKNAQLELSHCLKVIYVWCVEHCFRFAHGKSSFTTTVVLLFDYTSYSTRLLLNIQIQLTCILTSFIEIRVNLMSQERLHKEAGSSNLAVIW